MVAFPAEQSGPDEEEESSSDESDFLGVFRSVFGAWPRSQSGQTLDGAKDWRSSVDWSQIPEEEVLKTIQDLSSPAVNARLLRLWGAIGQVVAGDTVLAEIHADVGVESLHNGIPSQSAHIRQAGQSRILVNDGVADFTRHVTLTLLGWLEEQRHPIGEAEDEGPKPPITPKSDWAVATPLLRRILAFEGLSIAMGELWQPVDILAERPSRHRRTRR
jgi:hypothetical protein